MTQVSKDYFELMAQVGVTAFTLMFAAVQFRWRDWSRTRLGKLAAGTALLELLTVTLVSVAIATQVHPVWIITCMAAAGTGLWATRTHVAEFRRQRRTGWFPTPSDEFQMGAAVLPHISYGLLLLSPIAWSAAVILDSGDLQLIAEGVLAVDLAWFLFSGLTEVLITLSPNLLDPEGAYEVGSMKIGDAGSHALILRAKRRHQSGFPELTPTQEDEPGLGLVLLPEIWGVKPAMVKIAERLADRGYLVAIPDYYADRQSLAQIIGTDKRLRCGDESEIARVFSLAKDTREALKQRFASLADIDAVGLSLGGSAALSDPSIWRRVVSLYPASFTVKRPRCASNALILLATLEDGGNPAVPKWDRPDSSAEDTDGPIPQDPAGQWRRAFSGAIVVGIPGKHSFLGGRSASPPVRLVLRGMGRASFSKKASDDAWSRLQNFLLADKAETTP